MNILCAIGEVYREVCMEIVINESSMLGGFRKIVAIDESKFGKRKNNRRKPMNDKWVFGGLEKGPNKYFFKSKDRDSDD